MQPCAPSLPQANQEVVRQQLAEVVSGHNIALAEGRRCTGCWRGRDANLYMSSPSLQHLIKHIRVATGKNESKHMSESTYFFLRAFTSLFACTGQIRSHDMIVQVPSRDWCQLLRNMNSEKLDLSRGLFPFALVLHLNLGIADLFRLKLKYFISASTDG